MRGVGSAHFIRRLLGAPDSFVLGIFKPFKDMQVPLEDKITSVVLRTTFINMTND